MKNTFTAILILSAFLARPAAARLPEGDRVFAAMQDEMGRSMKRLEMDKLGKPYFIAYQVGDGYYFGASASFGAEESYTSHSYRHMKADLRVGSAEMDNSHYAPNRWEGYRTESDGGIALEDDYDALRFALWGVTDRAYKKALETFSKKKAFVESKNMTELYDDMTKAPRHELYRDVKVERLDEGLWRENLRKVSAVFLKYPGVKYSGVSLRFGSGGTRFLNSEGSAWLQPDCYGNISMSAHGYAPDGFPLRADHSESFCLAREAPSLDKLLAKAEELGRELAGMSESKPIKAYIGPVLFEEKASGKFFESLLLGNLSNPREVWTEKTRWNNNTVFRAKGRLVERLGMRVTSPFLNVTDDPLARYHEGVPLMGHYEADDEGVAAEKLSLVVKGKLKDYYMSRAATRDFKRSNGHGRAGLRDFPSGAPSNVFIVPENDPRKVMPLTGLRRRFAEFCREQEQEYCIRVSGLGSLYGPFTAWKVYTDGREEPVHGIEFTGITLRALRDVIAVSSEAGVYDHGYGTGGSIVAPSILVQEMEIKKSEKKPEKAPYLEHPYFAGHK